MTSDTRLVDQINTARDEFRTKSRDLRLDDNTRRGYSFASDLLHRVVAQALATPPKVGSGELDAAAKAVLESWDSRMHGEREELREYANNKYWAPRASLVDSSAIAQLRAALAAPVDHPEVVGVKIKPLGWSSEPPYSVARPFTGLHYATEVIWPENGKSFDYVMLSGPTVGSKRFASLSDAKADAQLDFETRIRSALLPSDSPALEAGVADGPLWWTIYDALDLSSELRLECTHAVFAAVSGRQSAALSIPATEDGK